MRNSLGQYIKGHPQSNTGRTHLKKGIIPWNTGKPLSEEHKEKDRRGHWKNGTMIDTRGYRLIYIKPHKYKAEHRLIVEKQIGRELHTWEIIHHINQNRLDNRIDNLQIVTMAEHRKLHKIRG